MLSAICALPAVGFILIANITGNWKTLIKLFLKLPSLVFLILMVIVLLSKFGYIKL
jgi:hypothetical protein